MKVRTCWRRTTPAVEASRCDAECHRHITQRLARLLPRPPTADRLPAQRRRVAPLQARSLPILSCRRRAKRLDVLIRHILLQRTVDHL